MIEFREMWEMGRKDGQRPLMPFILFYTGVCCR